MNVDEIPVASKPSGGWTGEMPPPGLAVALMKQLIERLGTETHVDAGCVRSR